MSTRAPENTLAAFELIARDGVSGIELDIHQCATGELVVIHDDTLTRTAGVALKIREAGLDAIREHEVGSWFGPRFTGEKVPTLTEVFELLGRRVVYDIEIKPYGKYWGPPAPGGTETTLDALIRHHGLADRCIVSSFDPFVLRRFARLATEIPAALIYTNTSNVPITVRHGRGRLFCRPDILKPYHADVTERFVRRRKARGRQVIPWTVGEPDEARRLSAAGVDGLISNVPDLIQSALT
ncbi:MAG: glycerophosphodiester phosphodiesterase family protein [Spirochaetia bacterium]